MGKGEGRREVCNGLCPGIWQLQVDYVVSKRGFTLSVVVVLFTGERLLRAHGLLHCVAVWRKDVYYNRL